jgi:hypothetical protein
VLLLLLVVRGPAMVSPRRLRNLLFPLLQWLRRPHLLPPGLLLRKVRL